MNYYNLNCIFKLTPYTIIGGVHKMTVRRITQFIAFLPRSQHDGTQPNGQYDNDFRQVEDDEFALVLSEAMVNA